MRARGSRADVLDPLVDDVVDPADPRPYDGVWAQACLLHVARADLTVVLARLHAATRPGGVLYCSVKEGDGEGWSTHGYVAEARWFVYWRDPDLRGAMTAAGWTVHAVDRTTGRHGEPWLDVLAVA